MVSVALDIFGMPEAIFNGKKYDSMTVCAYRHSGWVVPVPCQPKELEELKSHKK